MSQVVIGIDLGTSSVKVVALSMEGSMVASSQVAHSVERPHEGWAEQDPEVWWSGVCRALAEVLASGPFEAASIGLSGQMHGLVAIDSSGVPVRRAIIWSDSRSQEQVLRWSEAIGSARVEQIAGMPIATGMLGVSLSWVQDEQPDIYRRIAHVFSPKDYIRYRLTGVISTEPTDAAGGLLFDIRRASRSDEIADAVGLDASLFAPVLPTLAVAGVVTPMASDATGLPAGISVASGGGDQAMGALAVGLQDSGRAAVAISSGGTVFKRTSAALDPERGLHVMPYVRRDEWMAMGVVLAAGLSIDWLLTDIFGRERTVAAVTELMATADRIAPGSEGLLAVPHLGGTRTPRVDAQSRATFSGFGFAHGQAHMARALVEGVCLVLSASLESMAQAGEPATEILMSGGGARFAVWRQTLADVTGLPVRISSDLEHSAIGAALAGAEAAEIVVDFVPAARITATVDPDRAAHTVYRDLSVRFADLDTATAAARTHWN